MLLFFTVETVELQAAARQRDEARGMVQETIDNGVFADARTGLEYTSASNAGCHDDLQARLWAYLATPATATSPRFTEDPKLTALCNDLNGFPNAETHPRATGGAQGEGVAALVAALEHPPEPCCPKCRGTVAWANPMHRLRVKCVKGGVGCVDQWEGEATEAITAALQPALTAYRAAGGRE